MKTNAVKIRWFNDACYEIKLPGGKTILIDPYIDESRYKLLGSERLEGADYILISHSHFDHVLDLPKIMDRFDSQIFAGQFSGVELAKYYDIPGYRMNLCGTGDVCDTGDFVLRCYRGKHTNLGEKDRPSHFRELAKSAGLDLKAESASILGSYEYMIYTITLPSNLRILVWGGGATPAAIYQAKQFSPDITIAQLPREDTSQIAKLYAAIGGRVIFLHHHEYFLVKGDEGAQVIRETVEKTSALAPDTMIVLPEKGKWYSVSTCVELAE